ncbi:MAG: MYXO-CTERM sorting domain-containing protein [Polyangiaceae bacterium]|nr:MYXO-CTERM sorting domain-containing protein [Polyangiaceae bacterium]
MSSDEGGGCSVGAPGGRSTGAGALLLGLVLLARRRFARS